jgi:2-oxoisovalerate dehydrogenase E1 component
MKGTAVSNGKSVATHGLSRDELLRAYRTMVLSRKLDDKEIQLKSQSLIFFQISGAGHEAIVTAAGFSLRAGYDWFYPHLPRPRALPRPRRDAARDAAERRRRQGRSELRRPADAVSLGTHGPEHRVPVESDRHAVPAGGWLRRSGRAVREAHGHRRSPRAPPRRRGHLSSLGDGTTSEGEFWEAINYACLRRLPVVIIVEDNGYAISVPVEAQTPGGDISRLVATFPRLLVQSVDGTDYLASYAAVQEAVRLLPRPQGPAFITPRSPARTRIRCRTTSGSTRRRTSGPPKPSAIPSRGSSPS